MTASDDVRSENVRFTEFVASRLPALYRYAFVLTGNADDAEDLVQEALTRTGAAWHRVVRKDDPEGYVKRAMARLAYNQWRRPRREWLTRTVPERLVLDPGLARVDDADSLTTLLARLPPRQRAVLVLRYVQGLSEQEIADHLGCSTGTVKSQASKALATLRRHLGDEQLREATDGRA